MKLTSQPLALPPAVAVCRGAIDSPKPIPSCVPPLTHSNQRGKWRICWLPKTTGATWLPITRGPWGHVSCNHGHARWYHRHNPFTGNHNMQNAFTATRASWMFSRVPYPALRVSLDYSTSDQTTSLVQYAKKERTAGKFTPPSTL